MNRQRIAWFGKAMLAGLAALALLCLVCAVLYNVPVHYTNPDGATEYKYEPNRLYCRATEGFGYGRTNSDGFNNPFDYSPAHPIDILLMGSSHTEGFCLPQADNAAQLLSGLFAGEKTVYNIGMAGHTFLYCVQHLDAALTVYRPADCVLFELVTLSYDPAAMDDAAAGRLPAFQSHTGGLLTALQKLPFLRLFYTKYVKGGNEAVQAAAGTAEPADPAEYEAALSRLLQKLGQTCAAHGVRGILVYTPFVTLDGQGRPGTEARPGEREAFSRLCAENGLVFLDLSERFLAAPELDGQLPFGFANTTPGEGHINRLGHRLFAEAVYAALAGQEG